MKSEGLSWELWSPWGWVAWERLAWGGRTLGSLTYRGGSKRFIFVSCHLECDVFSLPPLPPDSWGSESSDHCRKSRPRARHGFLKEEHGLGFFLRIQTRVLQKDPGLGLCEVLPGLCLLAWCEQASLTRPPFQQ